MIAIGQLAGNGNDVMKASIVAAVIIGIVVHFGSSIAADRPTRSEPQSKRELRIAVEGSALASPGRDRQDRPNIVLILLDDVAFADTSTFGGIAQTPALSRLAEEGLRYNRFHTVGICSPTRAALLSGRNHHRVGYGSMSSSDYPGYNQIWPKSAASIAEVLSQNGYSTAAFGKWHNTPAKEITPVGPFDRWPTGLGFEYYYGNMLGMTSEWEPSLWRNTVPVQQAKTMEQGYYLTTDLVNEAIRWIQTQESLARGNPYFVYF
jgi:arylsulfatase A-like enzyme